ncbi:MAG TPA: tetratricopeptide repeat protein [Bryobacteraceae bacterium]
MHWVRSFFAVFVCALAVGAQSPSAALSLQNRGDWAGAEAVWRSLIRQTPGDYRLWTSLGVCLAHQKQYREAIADYRHALAISPHDPQTNLNLGLAYFKTGKLKQAIAPLKVAVAKFGRTPQLDLVLGMSLYGTGAYKAATPYLEAVQAREPKNPELQLVLARDYLFGGDYAKAKEQFRLMLLRDPDSAQVHLLLGEAYDAMGKEPQARAEFQQAAEKGKVPGAHFALGYLLWRDKHYDKAAAEFRQELARYPAQYAALAYLGDCLLKQRKTEEAVKWIRQSIATKDVLWITHYDLGVIAADKKAYASAVRQFRHSIRVDAKRPEAHYHLAQAYKALGKEREAVAELRTVTHLHAEQNEDLIIKLQKQKR